MEQTSGLFRPVIQPLLGSARPLEKAGYVVFGAPLDATASHRSGTRFAPTSIRQASLYMETVSSRTGLDAEDVGFHDAGDLNGFDTMEKALERIEDAVGHLSEQGKIPVMMGGEHTVTLGALRALDPDLVIVFDAHMDLRDTLLGSKMSHGTFMRRALEELDFRLIEVGVRAISKEEVAYAEGYPERISVVPSGKLIREGVEAAYEQMRSWLRDVSSVYISVDMDVVDPASAPAVGNPSPEGIGVTHLLDMMALSASTRVTGMDLTEVTPFYDSGLTATTAAYILLEGLCVLEMAGSS